MNESQEERSAAEPVLQPLAAAVSFKLPVFWSNDLSLPTNHVEATFSLKNIASQCNKFPHHVASLSSEEAAEVRCVLTSPPAVPPYDNFDMLLQRTTASQTQRLQQLLTAEEHRDVTLSQMLRRVRQLLSETVTAANSLIFRQLVSQRLPHTVCVMLGATTALPLESLASTANRLIGD